MRRIECALDEVISNVLGGSKLASTKALNVRLDGGLANGTLASHFKRAKEHAIGLPTPGFRE